LWTLGLGLTIWVAGPAAQAAQRPVAAGITRSQSHSASTARTVRATRAAQVALAAKYKYTLGKIAWTGSRLAIAATDSRGDLYYFWQKGGTTAWHKQLVASGGHGQAYSKPSITWTGNAVVIAVLDSSGDLIAFTQHAHTTSWKRKVVARASSGRFQAPSIAADPAGAVLISAGSTAGLLVSFELAPGHSSWARLTVGYGTFGSSSIITCYDSLVSAYLTVITATSGGTLDFWWERLDTPGWHQETIATAGPGGTYAGGSLAATTNELMITALPLPGQWAPGHSRSAAPAGASRPSPRRAPTGMPIP